MKKCLPLLIGAFLSLATTFALAQQTGSIRGQVRDGETGEPMIGATVQLEGLSFGANTDIDGQFNISNVPSGSYTLRVRYISYGEFVVTNVEVSVGRVAVVNPVLQPEGTQVGEVVITARQLRNSESSLLSIQRMAGQTLDAIGSTQITRTGDTDAGAAVRRVVGVTVENGRYVYVRGLGDRYGKTLLNGADIPGLDPDRNSVPIDLFPTALIDNLVVYKAPTPDLPGNFAGGLVDITTRDFPEQFYLNVGVQAGYNSQSTFEDNFLTYNSKPGSDAFALGNTDREIPGGAPQPNRPNVDLATNRRLLSAFSPDWIPVTETAPLDYQGNFVIGNQFKLLGKTFGYIASLNYRRQYNLFTGEIGQHDLTAIRYRPSDLLGTRQIYNETRGLDEVLWGALVNLSVKLNDYNKLSLNLIRNQNSETSARFLQGFLEQASASNSLQQTRILDYQQRSNSIGQLQGNHVIPAFNNLAIDWIASGIYTKNDQPDYRVFSLRYNNISGDPDNFDINLAPDPSTFFLERTTTDVPQRYFRALEETDLDFKLHITYPFQDWTGSNAKAKIGGSYTTKERDFSERIYQLPVPDGTYGANWPRIFSPEYLQANGIYYQYFQNFVNDYDGTENITAAYAMVDLNLIRKLRFVGGARLEQTDIEVFATNAIQDTRRRDAVLEQTDILPTANFIYQVNENTNLRFNYAATIARPVFRELARFTQFDFFGRPATAGNPDLERTLIQNLDVRYEYFPSPSEMISISGFYKRLENPIERAIDLDAGNFVTWRNVPEATVYGAELELRKNLQFIGSWARHLQLGLNASYVFSQVDIPEIELARARVANPNPETTRELFAQSPYIVNASLAYVNPESGSSFTLAFNVSGERLIVVNVPGSPNYYEQPRPSLDLNLLQRFGSEKRLQARLGVQNILNPDVRWTADYRGQQYDYQRFKEGVRVVLGVNYIVTK